MASNVIMFWATENYNNVIISFLHCLYQLVKVKQVPTHQENNKISELLKLRLSNSNNSTTETKR